MGAGWFAKAEKDAVHAEKDAVHVEKDAIHIEKEAFKIGTGAFQFFNALESFKLVEAGAFKDAFQFASTINLNLSAVPLVIVCMTFILCHFLLNISTEKLWLLLGTIFGISLAAYTVFLVIFANISPRSDVKLGSLATTFVFVGMPGMGKSWIINCLAGYDACRSGLAVTGNTNKVQSVKSRNDFHTFVDSPGLNEVGKKGQFTAKEVGKAVKLNGRVKYLFTMGTRNGRVREDDLATVSHVMRSLPPYTPFGLILNQLSREEYSFVMENFETYEKIVRCTLVHDYAASVGEEADNNQIYAEPPIFALPEYGGLWQRMFRRVTLPWPFIDFLANKCEAAEMDPAKVKDLKAAGREGHIQQVKDLYNDLQSTYEKIQTAKDDAKDAKEQNKVFQQKLDDALNAKKLSQEKYQKKELAPKERPVNGKYVLVNEGSQKVIDKDLCVVNRDPTKPAVESTVWLVQKAVAAEESADTYNLYSSDNKLLKCTSPGVLCLVENTPANADQDSCKWRVTETTRSHKGYWALKNKDTKFTIDNWFGQTGKNGAALKCEKSQEHHIPYLGGHTWKFMVVKKDD